MRPSASQNLGERIATARHRTFVGRSAELGLFRSAISGGTKVAVLHLHGPGGTGKTALLGEFARIAAERGASPLLLDGRQVEPTPDRFLAAFRQALGGRNRDESAALNRIERPVILIDTYEQIAPLDPWLRERFVPRLPAQAVLVVAGRSAPAPGWRSDPGLGELCRTMPLRNFAPDESRDYLTRRGVPAAKHDALLAMTHGHPLALALFTDVVAQRESDRMSALDRHPDVVQALMERFVASVPSPLHREALEVCAHARATTEAVLADVLEIDNAHEIFEWLRTLSFVEQGPEGLFPHDLARDVLESDFRWRNPERSRALHQSVRHGMLRRLAASSGAAKQRIVYDKLFLHRRSPLMRPYFDFVALDGAHIEPARPADHPAILDVLGRHEGEASAAIAARWLGRQPGAFQLWRASDGALQGVMAHLQFDTPEAADLDFDPAVRGIWSHVRRAGDVRPGECILIHRFWAGRDTYQDAASQTVIAAAASLLWMTLPHLAWSFPCTAQPDHWAPMFAYCNFIRERALDFEVGGRRYGVFAHDWRREPVMAWLDTLAEREMHRDGAVDTLPPSRPPQVLVLSHPDFEVAVRQALRDYTRPGALAGNPLVRSRLVAPNRDQAGAVAALQALLVTAVESLRGNPRDEKLYRAVWHTYFQPAESQELVAERLSLPFSTFRYHLKGGVDHIVEWLWQREVNGGTSLAN